MSQPIHLETSQRKAFVSSSSSSQTDKTYHVSLLLIYFEASKRASFIIMWYLSEDKNISLSELRSGGFDLQVSIETRSSAAKNRFELLVSRLAFVSIRNANKTCEMLTIH